MIYVVSCGNVVKEIGAGTPKMAAQFFLDETGIETPDLKVTVESTFTGTVSEFKTVTLVKVGLV